MNALVELKKVLEDNHISFKDINCASIWRLDKEHELVFDSEKDSIDILTNFLNEIEYYNGYGGQELFGKILTNKNSWLERGEYDGSEWWEYRTIPTKEDVKNAINQWKDGT